MDFSSLRDFFQFLLDSEEIIRYGGLALVVLIVFAENGLFFAFFLPGDYLLFLAGLFTSTQQLNWPITIVIGCIVFAAVLGSLVGYFFGMALGQNLEHRPDSFFFKRRHLEQSRKFFTKYGGRALVLARFMPIVRTFSPIIAGTIRMPFRSFMFYNILGGALWGVSLPLMGYYLGQTFPGIINYVEWIIVFFLTITTAALIRTVVQMRKERKEPAE